MSNRIARLEGGTLVRLTLISQAAADRRVSAVHCNSSLDQLPLLILHFHILSEFDLTLARRYQRSRKNHDQRVDRAPVVHLWTSDVIDSRKNRQNKAKKQSG